MPDNCSLSVRFTSESGPSSVMLWMSACDPKQPFVVSLQADLFSRFERISNKIESLGTIEFPLNVGVVHAISLSRYQA